MRTHRFDPYSGLGIKPIPPGKEWAPLMLTIRSWRLPVSPLTKAGFDSVSKLDPPGGFLRL